MKLLEYRELIADDMEFRAEGDGMTFRGYAAKFNVRSQPLPFIETILPGAFTRTLKSRNEIKAFVNHDTNMVLGSTRAGTLRLTQDERGLFTELDLPDTSYGRDLAISVKRGDVSGMSFGFHVPAGGDTWNADYTERTISEIALSEVSPVTGFPAYRQTTASVRSLPRLSARAGIADVEALAEAMAALEAGEPISQDQACLLKETIEAITETLDKTEEVIDENTAPPSLPMGLMQKMLDLSMKKTS